MATETEYRTTLEQTIDKYRQMLDRFPQEASARLALAELTQLRGLRLEALLAHQEILNQSPAPEARVALADVYASQGLYVQAFEELSATLKEYPLYPEAHYCAVEYSETVPLPDDLKLALERPCRQEELARAALQLGMKRSVLLRELQELQHASDRAKGDPLATYRVEETRKRLLWLERRLARVHQLEAQRVDREAEEQKRIQQLEALRLEREAEEIRLRESEEQRVRDEEEQRLRAEEESRQAEEFRLRQEEEVREAEERRQREEEDQRLRETEEQRVREEEQLRQRQAEEERQRLHEEQTLREEEEQRLRDEEDARLQQLELRAAAIQEAAAAALESPATVKWDPEPDHRISLDPPETVVQEEAPEILFSFPIMTQTLPPVSPGGLGDDLNLPAPPTPVAAPIRSAPVAEVPEPVESNELSIELSFDESEDSVDDQLENLRNVESRESGEAPAVAAAPEVAPTPPPAPPAPVEVDRSQHYRKIQGEVNGLIATLAKTRGVTSIHVVARDGYLVDQSSRDTISVERVGEFVLEGMSILETFASNPQYWVLECSGGIVVFQVIDAHHVLVAIGQAGANFGALRYTMDKMRPQFAQILSVI